jgi:hypothetical protein
MEQFTVPTLSLSGSRAKKHHNTSVPTRDYSQLAASHAHQTSLQGHHDSRYLHYEHYQAQETVERAKRTHIFPPRPPTAPQEPVPRDINKNVYLQSPDIQAHSPSNV